MLRNGRPRFLDTWQPRRRCGQGRPETFHRSDDRANASIGLQAAYRRDECESNTLAGDRVEARTKQHRWLDKVLELLAHRADSQRLWQLARLGQPPAAAILPALGDIHEEHNGTPRVKLAGLDIHLFASGASIRKLPQISPVGSAYRRYWL
jgi:hypothetical protein